MLTAETERRSCLASADRWRSQAEQVHEHAGRSYLLPRQREVLLAETEVCDRQADWWVAGADHYGPAATAGLATLLQ